MSLAKGSVARTLLWVLTIGGFALTRLPAKGLDITLIFIAGAVATLSLVFLSTFWSKAPGNLRGWVLLVSVGLILVPPAAHAVASEIPSWAIALLYVFTLHVYFRSEASRAPVIEATAVANKRLLLQYLPMVLFVSVILLSPLVKSFLPLRIRAVFEFQTALEPLVPLVLVGSLILVVSLVGTALDPRSSSRSRTEPDDSSATTRSLTEVDVA